jgi:hypothetical protein
MTDRHRIISISKGEAFAGQLSVVARVQYPGEEPSRVKFVGPSTRGSSGPVVMITQSGAQVFVTDPSRFGAFGRDWVKRFFEEA